MPRSPNLHAPDHVRNLQSRGFFLSAHDAAMAAIAAGDTSPAMRHAAVLSLARAGARSSALRLVEQWGLRGATDLELAGLHPRLLKDAALDGRRRDDAIAAAQAYQALWARHGSAWLGVNVAAMHALAGDRIASQDIARVIARLPDQGDYWSAATLAEAFWLLGDAENAGEWLQQAESRAGTDNACRATTRRQLRWEAALLGLDPARLDRLHIPETIHFCGVIPDGDTDEEALQAALLTSLAGVGYAFGSLAAGADIVIAEAALALGIPVTIILPYEPQAFIEHSVRIAGDHWVPRFERCLARVEIQVLDQTPQDDLDYGLASRRAMGLARLHASRLESPLWQLALWDGEGDAHGVAGTAFDIATWRQAGGQTRILPTLWRRRQPTPAATAPTRIRGAVLFSDIPGFGKFDDRTLAAFYAGPMQAMGQAVNTAAPLYRNAWGDAIQLVFETPAQAANCALALREALSPAALRSLGFQADLALRLALDFGALHPVFDAVQNLPKFAGRAMTRAARIEPITPPGMIYATEAFACEIALTENAEIACDYAGLVATAKEFGALPIYAVRRMARHSG